MVARGLVVVFGALCLGVVLVGTASATCNATVFAFTGATDEVHIIDVHPSGPAPSAYFVFFTNAGLRQFSVNIPFPVSGRLIMSARDLYRIFAPTSVTIDNSYLWVASFDETRLFAITIVRGNQVFQPECASRTLLHGGIP